MQQNLKLSPDAKKTGINILVKLMEKVISNVDAKKLFIGKNKREWTFLDQSAVQEREAELLKLLENKQLETTAEEKRGLVAVQLEQNKLQEQQNGDGLLEKGKQLLLQEQLNNKLAELQKKLLKKEQNNAYLKELAEELVQLYSIKAEKLELAKAAARKYQLASDYVQYALPCLEHYFLGNDKAYGYAAMYLRARENDELELQNPHFSYCLGYVLLEQGFYDLAEQQLCHTITCLPDHVAAHKALQKLYAKEHNTKQDLEREIAELLG